MLKVEIDIRGIENHIDNIYDETNHTYHFAYNIDDKIASMLENTNNYLVIMDRSSQASLFGKYYYAYTCHRDFEIIVTGDESEYKDIVLCINSQYPSAKITHKPE